jgi:hypothetical protein
MLDSSSISVVVQTYRPERDALVELLASLSPDDWIQPTECPAYSVKGVATHVLGDDLSLLSRQRDGAVQGLVYMAEELPGADFHMLLDAFNDQWVTTARFMSPVLLMELLRLTGEWTAEYYESVDPLSPGEPVGLFAGSTIRRSAVDSVWGHWRSGSSCAPGSRWPPQWPRWSLSFQQTPMGPGASDPSCSARHSRAPTS